ncbi:MAG: ABC transporter permease [Candidatus Dormibacteraeota bacterium]|nr:ABC transporter permease [Candidatus Dormibacteraeota bacterium]
MATFSPALEPEFVPDSQYEVGEAISVWRDTWRRLARNRFAVFGLCFIGLLIVVAVVAQFWTPYPIYAQGLGRIYAGPSLKHPLGLDQVGRDILSRLMVGAGIAVAVGLGTALLSSIIGIALGLLAGFYRGWVDSVITLVINVWYGIPDLLFVMLLVVILQSRDLKFIILAISLTAWLNMARLVRGQTLSLREREFVEAARSIGTRDLALLWRHILPNALGPIIIQASFLVPSAIIFEAFLSYLGFGVPPPQPSWGAMSAEGFQSLQLAPHVVLIPAFALSITLVALNAFGDGLRDAIDPRMRR